MMSHFLRSTTLSVLYSTLWSVLVNNRKWKRLASGILAVLIVCFLYSRSRPNHQSSIELYVEDDLTYQDANDKSQSSRLASLKAGITIHIGMAVLHTGRDPHASANVQDTFTWIVVHSSAPVHFHIVCDSGSVPVIETIMKQVERQARSGYAYTVETIDDVSEQLIQHLETIAPHFKLTAVQEHVVNDWLPLILPWHFSHLNRLIFFSHKIKLRADPIELYEHFDRFDSNQLIGLTLIQDARFASSFAAHRRLKQDSINKNLGLSPPLGWPGFNSAVILLDLEKIRHSDSIKRYLDLENQYPLITKYDFKTDKSLPRLDEWLTLVALEKAELFYTLPCQWNVQQIMDSDAFEHCRIDIKAMALDD